MSTNKADVLVKIRLDGGHQGVSDHFEEVREWALIYAFILDRLSAGTSLRGGELKHHRLPNGQSDRSHFTPA
jgi:hypothetical protein